VTIWNMDLMFGLVTNPLKTNLLKLNNVPLEPTPTVGSLISYNQWKQYGKHPNLWEQSTATNVGSWNYVWQQSSKKYETFAKTVLFKKAEHGGQEKHLPFNLIGIINESLEQELKFG
jgi:hypothetical protein